VRAEICIFKHFFFQNDNFESTCFMLNILYYIYIRILWRNFRLHFTFNLLICNDRKWQNVVYPWHFLYSCLHCIRNPIVTTRPFPAKLGKRKPRSSDCKEPKMEDEISHFSVDDVINRLMVDMLTTCKKAGNNKICLLCVSVNVF